MDRTEALAIINTVLAKRGRRPVKDGDLTLREAGISSLEFSLVALRVEERIGGELDFGGTTGWRVHTVADAIDLFTGALPASHGEARVEDRRRPAAHARGAVTA